MKYENEKLPDPKQMSYLFEEMKLDRRVMSLIKWSVQIKMDDDVFVIQLII